MILSDKFKNELISLEENIHSLVNNKSINQNQLEGFLRNLERKRYNILTQIKLYNNEVEYSTEKIKTISDEYKASFENNILKIYVPEPMPSYKNLKTHTYKNILLNIKEVTKQFAEAFKDKVFIYIKIYDNIRGWDIDNKYIKPISDALIASGVIKDDNIDKMFYSVMGEFSEIPHTEIFVFEAYYIQKYIEEYISLKCLKN